ncbi:lysine exporter LysO family protein [Anaerotignum lactatifermentans]|uniref:Lysine exporter LysO family protein n=1 Tax=Anaerotignum lactatifermentans TaxID=160404 RepID=A0ABS2GE92_9FIRM|nr:lysine exporter LysO family protein [Anaerotignum lactatifermentans]MBM6830427.1 lysine exporter LysO family protein [Anaerotignum lactatifermentans]MBM6878937.1 lysine exporter LysO family protein [Anaerotignum lactatifermentans]MBM6951975.1 lysine exporter LysO family protein [Anaerotignum lactatifermentans]
MSKAILIALALGIGAGAVMPDGLGNFLDAASSYMLLILLFSVGIDMGVNREVFGQIRRMGLRILVIPLGVVLGSLAGGALGAAILGMGMKEGLAITSGLGWYSLSGILMTEAGNPVGGTISFLSNVFREVLTFLVVPVLAGRNVYTAIAPAGATAMDTTLPLLSKYTDSKTAILAFVSGVICTLVVPVLVPIFC